MENEFDLEDFKSFLIEEIRVTYENYTIFNHFNLTIDYSTGGGINLSKLISEILRGYQFQEDLYLCIEIRNKHHKIYIDESIHQSKYKFVGCTINELQIDCNLVDSEVIVEVHNSNIICLEVRSSLKKLIVQGSKNKIHSVNIYRPYTPPLIIPIIRITTSINNLKIENIKSELIIIDNTVKKEYDSITLKGIESKLLEVKNKISSNFCLLHSIIERIRLYPSDPQSKIKIFDCKVEHIDIEFSSNIEHIELNKVYQLQELNFFKESEKKSISIACFILNDILLSKDFFCKISDIKISDSLLINSVINNGVFIYNSLTTGNEAKFEITDSLLGKVYFFNSQLPQLISLESSIVEDIVYVNSNIPQKISNVGTNQDDLDIYKKKKLAYKQLRISAEKNNDLLLTHYFRSKESNQQYEILRNSKGNYEDRIVFWLNQSNDYGQSWVRPIGLILLSTTILYSIFLCFLNSEGNVPFSNCRELGVVITSYFEFLIPGYLHPDKAKLDFVIKFGFNGFSDIPFGAKLCVYVKDILVMPYLIIQAVTAFRKTSTLK